MGKNSYNKTKKPGLLIHHCMPPGSFTIRILLILTMY